MEKNKDVMLERFARAANRFERDIAFMKWRWVGNLLLMLALIIALLFSFSTTNYLAIDKDGEVYRTKKIDRKDPENIKIESFAHAERFYSSMWTFNHGNIGESIKKAGPLGGNVINTLYKDLLENGFYNDIRTQGFFVTSVVDSIDEKSFSFNGNTIFIKVYGHMELKNNLFTEMRMLDLELEMVLVDRVLGKNPNGLSIENINVVSTQTVSKKEN